MAEIRTVEELRDVLGEPLPRVAAKDRDRLHPVHVTWLAASPLCLVATSAPDGTCDVSPKGDPAGSLVHVVDDRTIVLAERPGNRRADGFVNVLANPHVGLVFLVPGRGDTLRVNGRARLLRPGDDGTPGDGADDPADGYADALAVQGRRPLLLCEVEVEQVFFHCSKAFLRSRLWDPTSWAPDAVPPRADIAHAVERADEPYEQVKAYYDDPAYGTVLY